MTAKQIFIAVLSGLCLSIGGVFAFNEVRAQAQCSVNSDCAGGLVCVNSRCNVRPPIWDMRSAVLPDGQDASVYLSGIDQSNALRVGNLRLSFYNQINNITPSTAGAAIPREIAFQYQSGNQGFTVYNGAQESRLRVDSAGNVSVAQGLHVGPGTATGLQSGEVRATRGTFSETVTVGGVAVLTGVEASDTSGLTVEGTGRTRTVRLRECGNGQFLTRRDGAWVCGSEFSGLTVAGDLTVRGNILLPTGSATVDGVNLDNVITRPSSCEANRYLQWTGSAWQCATIAAGGAGVSDHGELTGLGDNDHPQYYLQTGDTRDLTIGRNLTVTGALTAASISTVAGGTVDTTTLTAANATVGGNSVLTTLTVGPAGGLLITGAGTSRFISLQSTCGNGEVLEWNANATPPAWQCATIEADEPAFTTWRGADVGAQTLANLTVNSVLTLGSGAPEFPRATSGVRVGGDVTASGCFGPTVVGATTATYDGNLVNADGYREVDALCRAAFGGSHQCTTDEVMSSIHCGAVWSDANRTTLQAGIPQEQFVWISNGAPSLPTPTNDCYGWTQTGVIGDEQSQGVTWYFDGSGGAGYARACNESYRVLCCR